MPTDITDVDEFTSPVTTPSNDELADEAAFAANAQQLANRTRNLQNQISALPTLDANEILARASTGVAEGKASSDVTLGLLALQTIIAHADALHTKSTDIASDTTTNLGNATGMFAHITGVTTIESFGNVAAGVARFLEFDGILTLTHNGTSLILPTAANITTAAGDTLVAISEGSGNWRVIVYQRADGTALSGASTLQDAYDGGPTISIDTNPVAISNSTDVANLLSLSRTFAGAGEALVIAMAAATNGSALQITHSGGSGIMIEADADGPGATLIDLKRDGLTVFEIDDDGAVQFTPPAGELFSAAATGVGNASVSTVDGTLLLTSLGTGLVALLANAGGNVLVNSVLAETQLSHAGGTTRALGDLFVDGLMGPQGFIRGLHIANDGATPDEIVDIDPGFTVADDGTFLIEATVTLSPDITAAGAGGLDTLTVAADTWYAVYVIADSTGVNAVSSLFSTSFTVGGITFPAGYDKARRVGAVRTDATSDFLIFTQARDQGSGRWTYWREEILVQTGGTASAFTNTTVSAATRVPPTATRQQVDIRSEKLGGSAPLSRVEVVPDGWNEAAGGMFWAARSGTNATVDINTGNIVEMPVGPTQVLRYRVQPAAEASADIVVVGWEDAL